QVERGGGEFQRFARREMAQRVFRRLGVVAERRQQFLTLFVVTRQLGRAHRYAGSARAFERSGDAPMQLGAPRCAEASVEDVAIERVAKTVARIERTVAEPIDREPA